jgi:GNAT superfamily N-acetyltransferase
LTRDPYSLTVTEGKTIFSFFEDKMDVDISFNCSGINWNIISETLRQVGMAYYAPDLHKKAFEASHTTVFAWHGGKLIGFGRAISDGVYQAAIYDVAVVPEFQGKGIGSVITKNILNKLSHCNIILYASPGKEKFYETLHFRKMKTGMALFTKAEVMAERGFTE